MKNPILLLLALLLWAGAQAQTGPQATEDDCHCGLTAAVEQYLEQNPVVASDTIKIKKLTDEEITEIAIKLCMNITVASICGFDTKKFKSIILYGLGVDLNTDEATKNKIVSNFLNDNKQKMICPRNTDDSTSRDILLYKTAILEGVIDLYDDILFDDDNYTIDFNACEIVDGKKETVIDYIDKLMATNKWDNDNLQMLKDDIIDGGGKTGAELDK